MSPASYNFHLAKVLGLFAVITAHFWAVDQSIGPLLAVPAQIGLSIFAFASGYFTTCRYRSGYSKSSFWRVKAVRLLVPLIAADLFLVVLFLIQGRESVFTWQSVLAWFGVVEVIRWFGLPRCTPFGTGLWFLTQLWIFYALYPLIARILRDRRRGVSTILFLLVVALSFERLFPMGVRFWSTAWFFPLGVFLALHDVPVPASIGAVLGGSSLAALAGFHYGLDFRSLDPFWVVCIGIGCILFLLVARIPRTGSTIILLLSAALLEMYVLHTYLFIEAFPGISILNWVASIGLTVIVGLGMVEGRKLLLGWFRTGRPVLSKAG